MDKDKFLQKAYHCYEKGDIAGAEEFCRKTLRNRPGDIEALVLLGNICYYRKDYDAAVVIFRKTLELSPDREELSCNLGLLLQMLGRYEESVPCFLRALQINPGFSEAYYNLGITYNAMGLYQQAVSAYESALKLNPHFVEAYVNLGITLQGRQKLDEALDCYQKALQINPGCADAYYNLGTVLQDKKQYGEAIDSYQKALSANPGLEDAWCNLGIVYKEMGEFDQAAFSLQKALTLDPSLHEAYTSLGLVFHKKEMTSQALDAFRRALELNPGDAVACLGMGVVLQETRHFREAIDWYKKALQIDPANALPYIDIGTAYREQWQLDEATHYFRKALVLEPKNADAYFNLGTVQLMQSRLDEAHASYRSALSLNPELLLAYQSLIMIMHYDAGYDPETIFSEHVRFAEHFAAPHYPAGASYPNEKAAARKLRIGYISPDFRQHSVAYFIEPVLTTHDRESFEVFCYSDVAKHDEVTDRLRKFSDHWRDIRGLSDESASTFIRQDGIDILVDLAGHTANNRIRVFAGKPAPVQVSWIGYPSTTGLATVDYKIVDRYTDPPGMTERYYTEELIRLEETFLCYHPERDAPEIYIPPVYKDGSVTFGSFSNYAKVTREVVSLWSMILHALPESRLVLKAYSFSDEATRLAAAERFQREGISVDRVVLLTSCATIREHLALYHRIDIGLDTFPYNGTTTTCEALWMGVPVITLAGKTHAARVGASLLSNIGLQEHIAQTREEYVQIAVELAGDTRRRADLRYNLRGMMLRSPLTDAKRFVDNLERSYRMMWEKWCTAG